MQFPRRPLLCLGTVQTGMAYGLAGAGQPDDAAVTALFDAALAAGIHSFDTARAYGLAEARLGTWLKMRGPADCEVITKFPKLAGLDDAAAASFIRSVCTDSRQLLGRACLDGLLGHNGTDLQRPAVAETLRALRNEGQIAAFGASVYDPVDADAALEVHGLGLLQVPLGLLDHRFPDSGVLARAKARGVRVYARSLYTQGLLFLDPGKLPPHLAAAAPILKDLRQIAVESGFSLTALALGYAAGLPSVHALVIGCDSAAQAQEAAKIVQAGLPPETVLRRAVTVARELPAGISDPRTWKNIN